MSRVSDLQAAAQRTYDSEHPDRDRVQAWFDRLPEIDLGILWGLACSEGVAYDDEVYEALDRRGWFDTSVPPGCVCATHNDGSVTTSTCPVHADVDPCLTMSLITGRRRTGTIRRGTCTSCGHRSTAA